jgi:Protein of unknown function (DUF669)
MPISWSDMLAEADAGGSNYDPLPVGDYTVVIDEASHTTSQSGKLMFKTKMKVEGGPHNGRLVWNQFVISPESPKALGIFFSQMKALGLGKDFFEAQPSEDVVVNSLVGKRANVTVGQREWQGQMRNEIKSIKPSGDASSTAAPATPSTPATPPSPSAAPAASPVAPF